MSKCHVCNTHADKFYDVEVGYLCERCTEEWLYQTEWYVDDWYGEPIDE